VSRLRRRKLQQALFDTAGRPLVRDGKRVRARRRRKPGRKPKGARAGSPHKARPELKPWQPVHVVLRVVEAIGSLRKRHAYKALREATLSVAKRELDDVRDGAFRIIHISIQRNHVHLVVEADHKMALSRGMQSFQISAAKHLNRAVSVASIKQARSLAPHGTGRSYSTIGARRLLREQGALRRRGPVFPDRFHQEIITTPKQARHALAYVLNNWRKHREDRWEFAAGWNVDPYSTGSHFDGWKEREDAVVLWQLRETYQPMIVYLPRTWLLRVGWRKHGLISFDEVPGSIHRQEPRVAS
jgi:REP element-mobilizing transposase RayT